MAATRIMAMTSRLVVRRLHLGRRRRPSALTRISRALDGEVMAVVVVGPRVPAKAAVGPRVAAVERRAVAAAATTVAAAEAAATIAITVPAAAGADRVAGVIPPVPGASMTTSAAADGSGRRPTCFSWPWPSFCLPAVPSRRCSSRAYWAPVAVPVRPAISPASPTRRRRVRRRTTFACQVVMEAGRLHVPQCVAMAAALPLRTRTNLLPRPDLPALRCQRLVRKRPIYSNTLTIPVLCRYYQLQKGSPKHRVQ